jgi:hypothetical protein
MKIGDTIKFRFENVIVRRVMFHNGERWAWILFPGTINSFAWIKA